MTVSFGDIDSTQCITLWTICNRLLLHTSESFMLLRL